jgi:hypothetical protein
LLANSSNSLWQNFICPGISKTGQKLIR